MTDPNDPWLYQPPQPEPDPLDLPRPDATAVTPRWNDLHHDQEQADSDSTAWPPGPDGTLRYEWGDATGSSDHNPFHHGDSHTHYAMHHPTIIDGELAPEHAPNEEAAPEETAPTSNDTEWWITEEPEPAPSETHTPPPPHTPQTEHTVRTETRGVVEAVRVGVVRGWSGSLGRLSPAVWWLARVVWRRPVWWGVAALLVVWATRVSVEHMLAVLGAATALALGPSGGATNRRERFVSLREVGDYRKRRRRVHRRWTKMWANAGLVRPALTAGANKRLPQLRRIRPHRDGVTIYVSGEDVAVGVQEVISSARQLTETVGALSLRVTKPAGTRGPLPKPPRVPERFRFGVAEALGAPEAQALLRGETPAPGPVPGVVLPAVQRDVIAREAPWRDRGHHLAIILRFRDPFPARPIRLSELPAPSKPGSVVVGLDEEGRGLEKSLFLPSLLVGAPGSGKSTEVWTTLRALREAKIPFRLRVFDPKGGLELGDLKEAAYRYESVPSRWPRFLEQACEALRVRQEIMARRGLRKVPEPDEEFPLDLMLIDELVTVLAMSRGQEARVRVFGQEMSAKEAFVVYLSQIRASLGSCIALSQVGDKATIGQARGMFQYISCLRVGPTEKELVDILLGQGAHNMFPAHELDPLDPNMAGRGWVRTKGGIVAYRAAFMNDEERAAEAAEIGKATARFKARGQRDPEVQERVRSTGRSRRPASAAARDKQDERAAKVTDRRSSARTKKASASTDAAREALRDSGGDVS